MASELARTFTADGEEITLNPAVVTRYILGGKQVPEVEMAKAIMTCAARKLNPFSGDVHFLTHYDRETGANKLTVSPSKDYYLRRAFADPRFQGIDDGVTILCADGKIRKRRGSAVYKDLGEKLLGGWAIVYVKGFVEPVRVEVSLAEYNTGMALWKSKPATMIVKVADSQGLRKAFPDLFAGTYERAEIGFDEPEETYETPRSYGGGEPCSVIDGEDFSDVCNQGIGERPEPSCRQVYEMEGF